MAKCMSSAGIPGCYFSISSWTPNFSITNRSSIFCRFVLRGDPSSGTLSPIITSSANKITGLHLDSNGMLVFIYSAITAIEQVAIPIAASGIKDIEHAIEVSGTLLSDGESCAMEFLYFGATVYTATVPRDWFRSISLGLIGSAFDGVAPRVTVPIEIRELVLNGSQTFGWSDRINDSYRNLNIRYDNHLVSDTLTTWNTNYGADKALTIVNQGTSDGRWWKSYDPSPYSGTYSVLLGTTPGSCIRYGIANDVPYSGTDASFYQVTIEVCLLFVETTIPIGVRIGLLSDSSGQNGIFIVDGGYVGFYQNGTELGRTTTVLVRGAHGQAGRDFVTINVVVNLGNTASVSLNARESATETVFLAPPIPDTGMSSMFFSTPILDTICGQSWNPVNYRYLIKFSKMSVQGFWYDGAVSGIRVISAATAGGRGDTIYYDSARILKIVDFDQNVSPWVYESSEYPIQPASDKPIEMRTTVLTTKYISKSEYAGYFALDASGYDQSQVSYKLYTGSPDRHFIDQNTEFLTLQYTEPADRETIVLQATLEGSEEFETAYVTIHVSSTYPMGFSGFGFDLNGFNGVDVLSEQNQTIRRPAFESSGFEQDGFEMVPEVFDNNSGVYRWSGSGWYQVPLARWDGVSWQPVSVTRWNGVQWVTSS